MIQLPLGVIGNCYFGGGEFSIAIDTIHTNCRRHRVLRSPFFLCFFFELRYESNSNSNFSQTTGRFSAIGSNSSGSSIIPYP